MALENAPPKGKGTIGGVKKEYVYAGAGILGVLVLVVYYRSKQQSQQATGQLITDPAGNQCAVLDPASGYCPGTPQQLAYTGAGANLVGQNAASSVGGQIIGYDQYGNPIYSSGPGQNQGPGSFTNNAAWAQAAEQTLIQQDPNANPGTIAAAIAVYIEGKPPTADQLTIIQEAIAFEGLPPQGGPNGFPPNIVTTTTPPPPPPPGKINNLRVTAAYDNITGRWTGPPGATSYSITVTDHQGANVLSGPNTSSVTNFTARGLPQHTAMAFHVTANPGGQTAVAYTETKGTLAKVRK